MKNLTEIILALIAAYTISNGGHVEKDKPYERPKSYQIKTIKTTVNRPYNGLELSLRGTRSRSKFIPTGNIKIEYDAMMRYGKELMQHNRYEEALDLYRSADKMIETEEVCYKIARILFEHKKNTQEAIKWVDKSLDINHNYTPAKFLKYKIESKN